MVISNEPNAASNTHFKYEVPLFCVEDQSFDDWEWIDSKQNTLPYLPSFNFSDFEKENEINVSIELDGEDEYKLMDPLQWRLLQFISILRNFTYRLEISIYSSYDFYCIYGIYYSISFAVSAYIIANSTLAQDD
jgi:hypothetical protein